MVVAIAACGHVHVYHRPKDARRWIVANTCSITYDQCVACEGDVDDIVDTECHARVAWVEA